MRDFELPETLSHCVNLSIDVLYDDASHRPILQVSQAFGNGRRFTLRYAISPTASVPFQLLVDVLATFDQAVIDAVRHQVGLQEELELRDHTGSSTESGRVSPSS
jgi:hypothetical protein